MSRLSLFTSLVKLFPLKRGPNTCETSLTPLRLEVLERRTLLSAQVIDATLAPELAENAGSLSIPLESIFDDTAIEGTILEFDTVVGSYFAELFDSLMPATVANFLNYVTDNDYVNSFIHRSIPGFVIQGGGFAETNGEFPVESVPVDNTIVVNEFSNHALVNGGGASVAVGGAIIQLPGGTDLSQIQAGNRIRVIGLEEGLEYQLGSGGTKVSAFYFITDVNDGDDTITVARNQTTLQPASFSQDAQDLHWYIVPDVNVRGTLSPPKQEELPDSASSGFFVNLVNNSENLDIQNEGFAVFGEVVYDGMTVVDAIATLPRVNGGGPFTTLPVVDFDSVSLTPDNLVYLNDVNVVNELSYEIVSNSNSGSVVVSLENGSVILNPAAAGSADITLRATDVDGNTAELTFTVTITATGDLNLDGAIDAVDIDLLREAISNGTSGDKYNIDGIGGFVPNVDDFNFMITEVLGIGFGDGDLNKVVDFDDFVLLTNNFDQFPRGWGQGNFNLDDETNFDDFVILTNNFNNQYNSASSLAVDPLFSQMDISLRRTQARGESVNAVGENSGDAGTITLADSSTYLIADSDIVAENFISQDHLNGSISPGLDQTDIFEIDLNGPLRPTKADSSRTTNDPSLQSTTVERLSGLVFDELLLPS